MPSTWEQAYERAVVRCVERLPKDCNGIPHTIGEVVYHPKHGDLTVDWRLLPEKFMHKPSGRMCSPYGYAAVRSNCTFAAFVEECWYSKKAWEQRTED